MSVEISMIARFNGTGSSFEIGRFREVTVQMSKFISVEDCVNMIFKQILPLRQKTIRNDGMVFKVRALIDTPITELGGGMINIGYVYKNINIME